MCFNVSLSKKIDYIEKRFQAKFFEPELFNPIYHANAFSLPRYPVITSEDKNKIQFYQWGLIPSWAKDEETANKIRFMTFNAKEETIFEKPSFKQAIGDKRCLVIVDGFYEWQEVQKKKYPYRISLQDKEAFSLAGIWDSWENNKSGKVLNTFSIITTKANSFVAKIHNTRRRMPVILNKKDEKKWLKKDLNREEIKELLIPYKKDNLEAYTVSKLITTRGVNTNTPEVMDKYEYAELK